MAVRYALMEKVLVAIEKRNEDGLPVCPAEIDLRLCGKRISRSGEFSARILTAEQREM